jgi:hypothetical protein
MAQPLSERRQGWRREVAEATAIWTDGTAAEYAEREIPPYFDVVRTIGLATVGDGQEALYKRVDEEPDDGFRDARGQWWERVPGSSGNDKADNDLANVAADDFAAKSFTATTGTSSRTLAARFGERLTPYDFGATGLGVADDTASFKSLATSGKKGQFVTAGSYLINLAGGIGYTAASIGNGYNLRGNLDHTITAGNTLGSGQAVINVTGMEGWQGSGLKVTLPDTTNSLRGFRFTSSEFVRLSGCVLQADKNGHYPIFAQTSGLFHDYSFNDIRADSIGILVRNSLTDPEGATGTIEHVNAIGNFLTSVTDGMQTGVSFDSGVSFACAAFNHGRDILSSDNPDRGFLVAFANETEDPDKGKNVLFLGNFGQNIQVEGVHVEDGPLHLVSAFNFVSDAESHTIVQCGDEGFPTQNLYIGNMGDGLSENGMLVATGFSLPATYMTFAFNSLEDVGAGDPGNIAAYRMGAGTGTKAIMYLGNTATGVQGDGYRLNAVRSAVISHSMIQCDDYFLRITNAPANACIYVESNNIIDATDGIVELAATGSVYGDKVRKSIKFSSGAQNNDLMFVASRPCFITAVKITFMTAAAASTGPTFRIGTSGSNEIFSKVLPTTASAFDKLEYRANADFAGTGTGRLVDAGDVITAVVHAASTGTAYTFVAEVEFFEFSYANGLAA